MASTGRPDRTGVIKAHFVAEERPISSTIVEA